VLELSITVYFKVIYFIIFFFLDLHFLGGGGHGGMGFPGFPLIPPQWLEASYLTFWPEYLRRPPHLDMCKLPPPPAVPPPTSDPHSPKSK
jgi:hypothetical protein